MVLWLLCSFHLARFGPLRLLGWLIVGEELFGAATTVAKRPGRRRTLKVSMGSSFLNDAPWRQCSTPDEDGAQSRQRVKIVGSSSSRKWINEMVFMFLAASAANCDYCTPPPCLLLSLWWGSSTSDGWFWRCIYGRWDGDASDANFRSSERNIKQKI